MTAITGHPATVGTAPARRPRGGVPAARFLRAGLRAVSTLLFVGAAVVLVAMTIGPRLFHYRTATMLTGSMVPTINPGDVIVDVRESAADIRVGQIITYQIPVEDHRVESHRVIWDRHLRNGAVLFRTKGDANNGADPWTARAGAGQDMWRVRTVLPLAGDVIRFLRRPAAQIVLTRILPILLLGSILLSIWRPPSRAGVGDDDAEEARRS